MSRVDSIGINEEIVKGVIDPMKAEREGVIDPYEDGLDAMNEDDTMTGLTAEEIQLDPAAARQKINGMMQQVAQGYGPQLNGESAYKEARGVIT
ncbi:MAG: hypothetical protein HRT47_06255 [Candidatus Caenarcaniphilales bacterium]|nr:hypothetical protein [Candidatus Caenarcaniphilales bacterium]